MAQKLVHYLGEEMAYTGCWKVIDNRIVRLAVTDIKSEVTCRDCLRPNPNQVKKPLEPQATV